MPPPQGGETVAPTQTSTPSTPKPDPTPILVMPPSAYPALGPQKTIVLFANYKDSAAKGDVLPTPDYSMIAGTIEQVDSHVREGSYGQTWLSGVVNPSKPADVAGVFTLSAESTQCGYYSYSEAINLASAAGVNIKAYDRIMLITPPDACPSQGAESGVGKMSLFAGGTFFQAGVLHVSGLGHFNLVVIAHEFGHSLGLLHSTSMAGGSPEYDRSSYDYGDNFDIMGLYWSGMHFNAFQKEHLGWWGTQSGSRAWMSEISANGTYVLEAYASQSAGLKAIKIFRKNLPGRGNAYFYVQYHAPIGWDGTTSKPGILLHHGYPTSYDGGTWIPMADNDGLMVTGSTFTDVPSGITIAVISINGATATVKVSGLP